jgi:hypothetical protein
MFYCKYRLYSTKHATKIEMEGGVDENGPNDASCVVEPVGTFLYFFFVYFDTNQCFIVSTLRNTQGDRRWL